jgi:hypothetical protein
MDGIRQTLDHLNQAWRTGRFEDLYQFFAEDVVMKGPGLKEIARGRDALVRSYADFMSKSNVLEYSESNYFANQWETTAIAGYDWSMIWEQGGKTDRGSGQDMFVFERRDSRWVAVLRLMLL